MFFEKLRKLTNKWLTWSRQAQQTDEEVQSQHVETGESVCHTHKSDFFHRALEFQLRALLCDRSDN